VNEIDDDGCVHIGGVHVIVDVSWVLVIVIVEMGR